MNPRRTATLAGWLWIATFAESTIPEFLWELSLGIYLVVKGFKPSPLTEDARWT